jgi:hypothetical protein
MAVASNLRVLPLTQPESRIEYESGFQLLGYDILAFVVPKVRIAANLKQSIAITTVS